MNQQFDQTPQSLSPVTGSPQTAYPNSSAPVQQVPYLAPQGHPQAMQVQMGQSPYQAPQYQGTYTQPQVVYPYQGTTQTAVMAYPQATAVMATQAPSQSPIQSTSSQVSQAQAQSNQDSSNPWQQAFHGLLDRTLNVLSTPVRFPGQGQSSPASQPYQEQFTTTQGYPASPYQQTAPLMQPTQTQLAQSVGLNGYSQPSPGYYNPSLVGPQGQVLAQGVTYPAGHPATQGMPAPGRADGFPSSQEVLSQVDAGDLNRYACQLEDALHLASGENLKLREMLLNPDHLTGWTQYMFGQGGPFDVTTDPQYQQFIQVWNAAGFQGDPGDQYAAYQQQYGDQAAEALNQQYQQYQQYQQQQQFNPRNMGYQSPLYQPASSTTSIEEQAIQQQMEMQQALNQQAVAQNQAVQNPNQIRQGFPAPPAPAVGQVGVEQFRQAFYNTAPEERINLINQIQSSNPNLIRQMAAGMFQF